MSQSELLGKVAGVLVPAGIPFLVTGSIVSSLQGEPRSSHDIDLVVALDEPTVPILVEAFPFPRYYLDEHLIREALRRRNEHGMFCLTEVEEGDKVDFWVLPDDPFEQSRLQRSSVQNVLGSDVPVPAPEDTILAKLRWARMSGGSRKQMGDALGVYEVQFRRLDQQYLDQWADYLGVADLLGRLREDAEPL